MTGKGAMGGNDREGGNASPLIAAETLAAAALPATVGKPMDWQGRDVLITGGLGFIGSTLAHRLLGLGARVCVVDSLIPNYGGNLANVTGIAERIRIEPVDLRDRDALPALVRDREVIFNLAGQTSHMDSMTDPVTDLAINAEAQLHLLEACRAWAPDVRLVFASTRQIYGAPDYLPVDERHPLRPVDVNGINKLAGEGYHLLYHWVHGLKASALRLTNTYGPRMRIRDARQTFLGVWIRRILQDEPFEVWGGAQLRDFTYIDDAVDAFLAAAAPAAEGRVFNIGGFPPMSLLALADALVAANGGRGRYEVREFPSDRKKIDIGDYHADDSAFRAATGWTPKVDVPEGLARSLDYFRTHLARYR
jgi:UDP-glucose 4-epimerase